MSLAALQNRGKSFKRQTPKGRARTRRSAARAEAARTNALAGPADLATGVGANLGREILSGLYGTAYGLGDASLNTLMGREGNFWESANTGFEQAQEAIPEYKFSQEAAETVGDIGSAIPDWAKTVAEKLGNAGDWTGEQVLEATGGDAGAAALAKAGVDAVLIDRFLKLPKGVKSSVVDAAKDMQKAVVGGQPAAAGDLAKAVEAEEAVPAARIADPELSPRQIQARARKAGNRITVKQPTALSYPDVYMRPDLLVAGAKTAPENPMMKQLFGVNRQELFELAEEGRRKGNITERPYKTAARAKGSRDAPRIITPANTQRVTDIVAEAQKRPDLYPGMAAWYTMDPLYHRFEQIWGPEKALEEYNKFNTLTGMSSPGSEVLTELNRGTGANMLAGQGRFEDFMKYGGIAEDKRGRNFPQDMRAIMGHAYHKTSQAPAMRRYLESGNVEMGTAKVPSYIPASGVPQTGFQTQFPVGDAHLARIVGLPDVRPLKRQRNQNTGQIEIVPRTASASVPEMVTITPWLQRMAADVDIEPVPFQATLWGAGSHATGVTTPVGAPKLELFTQQVEKAANRLGVSPETALDLIVARKAHAGHVDPRLLYGLGGAGALGAMAAPYFLGEER